MANTYKKLAQGAATLFSANNIYTVPADTKTIVTSIRICNYGVNEDTICLYHVPSGGTAATTNALYYAFTIPAYSTLSDDGKIVLEAGDSIQVESQSNETLTVTISGLEIT